MKPSLKDRARYHDRFRTSIGELTLLASDDGLLRIYHQDGIVSPELFDSVSAPDKLAPYKDAIEAYLNGQPQSLNIALDIAEGTPFQQSVWRILQTIPYGHSISYSELAAQAGRPSAVRAAASACGKNPLPLAIACHRVKQKGGKLGGFAWGVAIKQRLLAMEAATQPPLLQASAL